MWLVFMPNGKSYRFENDEAAQIFMLRFLEDETLTPVSPQERRSLIDQLAKSFQERTQLREGWGIGKDIQAVFKEF